MPENEKEPAQPTTNEDALDTGNFLWTDFSLQTEPGDS
jgi:hypothetical protein